MATNDQLRNYGQKRLSNQDASLTVESAVRAAVQTARAADPPCRLDPCLLRGRPDPGLNPADIPEAERRRPRNDDGRQFTARPRHPLNRRSVRLCIGNDNLTSDFGFGLICGFPVSRSFYRDLLTRALRSPERRGARGPFSNFAAEAYRGPAQEQPRSIRFGGAERLPVARRGLDDPSLGHGNAPAGQRRLVPATTGVTASHSRCSTSGGDGHQYRTGETGASLEAIAPTRRGWLSRADLGLPPCG
jgi:hypothetical protein